MNVLYGHRERLRKRLEQDPVSLSDAEIMELVLGLAIPRKDLTVLARKLVGQFGFRGSFDARSEELLQLNGFGPGCASLWRLVREVLARYAAAPILQRDTLSDPQAVARLAQARIGHLPDEECWVALVDAQNHLIAWEKLRAGGVNSVAIQPRDVLELALLRKASGIILAHNHPGGDPHPSKADLAITQKIKELAPALGLRMLDHVIVTLGDCYSISLRAILQVRSE